ncbi:uncharacterized, partial [Tachysurus ichikawai]
TGTVGRTVGLCGFVSRLLQASFETWRSAAALSHAAKSFSLAVAWQAGHMPSPCSDVPAGRDPLCKAVKQAHNPLLPVCCRLTLDKSHMPPKPQLQT